MNGAPTATTSMSPNSNKPRAQTRPPADYSAFETWTKPRLLGLHKYNGSIISDAIRDNRRIESSVYLMQVVAEQAAIESRLARIEQEETENVHDNQDEHIPEYVMRTKLNAINRPIEMNKSSRIAVLTFEEAAEIERQQTASQRKPKAPPPVPDAALLDRLSEKEKHRRILEFMNYRESDDEDDTDSDEEMLDNEDDAGARGGEWLDTDDLSQFIRVDDDKISAGGQYTNHFNDN